MTKEPFWRRKKLTEMNHAEWESLCDGCGKCCLHKLEDVVSGRISCTDVACRLLDIHSSRCTDYPNRTRIVDDCLVLDPKMVSQLDWMPSTCAYRLVDEGGDLAWWHHLVSGDRETVHLAGMSVRIRAVPEYKAGNLADHVVKWPE